MNNEQQINHIKNEIEQIKALRKMLQEKIEILAQDEMELYDLQVKSEDELSELL
jgi:hypothetical protein